MLAGGSAGGMFPDPVYVTVDEGGLLIRVHRTGQGPIFFGPSPGRAPMNRFDAPAREYRLLYAAERLEGAFVETILRRPSGRILRREYVNQRSWTALRLGRPLVLAKLHGEGLQAYGVDAGQLGIDDYRHSRALALSIFTHLPAIDGLAYRSRYNNDEICYAVFDRVAATDFSIARQESFDTIPDRVDQLMRLHRAVFDRSSPIPDPPAA